MSTVKQTTGATEMTKTNYTQQVDSSKSNKRWMTEYKRWMDSGLVTHAEAQLLADKAVKR